MNLPLMVIALALGLRGTPPPDADAAVSPPEPAAQGEDAPALLARLAKAAADVESLQATFRQVRHTPLLRKPMESTGTIQIGPKLVIWETEKPARSIMSVAEGEVRLYYPDEQLLEIYSLSEQISAAVATPLLRPDRLQEQFEISYVQREDEASEPAESDGVSPGRIRFRLRPKAEDLRIRVASICIDIEVATGLVRRGEMLGADGDRTEVFFDDIELDPEGSLEDPTQTVPEGTTVSRPGGGTQPETDDNGASAGGGKR